MVRVRGFWDGDGEGLVGEWIVVAMLVGVVYL